MELTSKLQIQIIKTVCVLSRRFAIPDDIAAKTYDYYLRVLSGMVRELYNNKIMESEFVTMMADLVQAQLNRAWNEGMRANDLDPATDMEDEWIAVRDEAILDEYEHVDQFAADIVAAREAESGWDLLLARAAIWANRYNDIVNLAILTTKEQKLRWVMGATEEHCDTCARLNGIVAFTSEWDLAGVVPQNPPNDALDCGGWRCQCRLEPTKDRKTRGAWERIMSALG